MLKLVLVCVVGVALAQEGQDANKEGQQGSSTDQRSGQGQGNTRIFGGLGGLVNTAAAAVGGLLNPALAGVSPNFQNCRNYCRSPVNPSSFVCCDHFNQGHNPVFQGGKPGTCPPVRPQCPPTRFRPTPCVSDTNCGLNNPLKCCYDTCLQQRVCKSPDPVNTGFQGGFQGGVPGGFQGGFPGR